MLRVLLPSFPAGTRLLQGQLERYLDGNRLAVLCFVRVEDEIHHNGLLCFLGFFMLCVWQSVAIRAQGKIVDHGNLLIGKLGSCRQTVDYISKSFQLMQ